MIGLLISITMVSIALGSGGKFSGSLVNMGELIGNALLIGLPSHVIFALIGWLTGRGLERRKNKKYHEDQIPQVNKVAPQFQK